MKDIRINVRLTREDYAAIVAAAKAEHETLAAFVRKAALDRVEVREVVARGPAHRLHPSLVVPIGLRPRKRAQ